MQYFRYLPGLLERGIRAEIFTGTPKATKIWNEDRGAAWARLAPGSRLPESALNGATAHGVRLPDDLGRKRTAVYFESLMEHCRNPATRPDVLSLMINFSTDSLDWVRSLRGLEIPIVYSLTIAPRLPGWRLARQRKLRLLRRHYDLMDCIVVQSLAHARWLREIGFENRIEVVPNGLDSTRYHPARDAAERTRLRGELGFAETDAVVTTVGAVSPRKGTDVMIEALGRLRERHPNVRLVIIGWHADEGHRGDARFRKRMADLLSDAELARRVQFTGVVDNVSEYLQASDVFLFASDREGFPNAILEAMASGLPTVTTPFLGWGEDFGEAGKQYLLVERSPQQLASAVGEILEKPALRNQLATEGVRWIRESMQLDHTLDLLQSLYEQLAVQSDQAEI